MTFDRRLPTAAAAIALVFSASVALALPPEKPRPGAGSHEPQLPHHPSGSSHDNTAASPIAVKYAALGGAGGWLGSPNGAEQDAANGGRLRNYQNGAIYWSKETAAHAVKGLILQRWRALGAESGEFGYPMTDEIGTFDAAGTESKFQQGELIWHKATNAVTEVRSKDLRVDLPFPQGEPWYIIQANGIAPTGDSHFDAWAYCWDFMLAGKPQSATQGTPVTSVAKSRIVWVDENYPAGEPAGDIGNTIVQRLGEGKYASYLHLQTGSYSTHFGKPASGGFSLLPQALPWDNRPIPRTGEVLAVSGNTGANAGAYHLHFCVTTSPDRSNKFAPFESVPVGFQNYSVSTDSGAHWKHFDWGVPRRDDWVRRDADAGNLSSPNVNDSAYTIDFGVVKGDVKLSGGEGHPSGNGTLTVSLMSAWGEPLRTKTYPVSGGNGPWHFEFGKAQAYPGLKIAASYSGAWSSTLGGGTVAGESGAFTLAPNGSVDKDVTLKATALH